MGRPFILFATLGIFCCATAGANNIGTVYTNAKIYTANKQAPWASALVVKGEKIAHVGDHSSALAYTGPGARVVDLAGKLILPGMVDAHTHPGMVAASHDFLEMEVVQDRAVLMKNVAEMITSNPDREFILGGSWDNGTFGKTGPDKTALDKIESERPVILFDYWGHSVWVNSRALEVAGIDRDTQDIIPGFSFYQRDASGEPSGWVTESASSLFVNNFLSITPTVENELVGFLTYLRSMGVTTLLDAGNFGIDDETYAALSRLDKSGRLPVRYHASFTLFVPQDYETAISQVKALNEKYGSDRLRIDTLKIFHDGVIETRTADMFDDYLDTPGNSGDSLFSEEQLHSLIIKLSKEQINVHVHSVGDKSTNKFLNAVERAHETLGGPPPIRIAICHLETVLDTDFYRFKDLGVIASFTPAWHGNVADHNVISAIGDKALSQMRAQPMIADDAVVTFSSDITTAEGWRNEAANPYYGIQIGHNRQPIEGGANARYAPPRSERLRLDTLVDGYTINGAYQLGRSHELGSIEVGKQADLVVLNQNLFNVSRYDVHKTKPVAVIMDGKLVHGEL
ncbi:MAG: amidohydrolase [Woeseia sp.]|nr:amidohydrolase [Woeseia sp.]